jgi:hypothetical protein
MPAPPDLASLVNGVKANGVLTLDPPRKEFQGPIVIRQPMTIQGQGSTIWAEKGPVVIIESPGVTLNDLNIEVTGSEEKLNDEQKCALLAKNGGAVKLQQVGVRGEVDGVAGEERGWHYPRILRLHKLKAGQEHQFRIRLQVPVACKIESSISGVELQPRNLVAGSNEILLRIEKLGEGIRLRGPLKLLAGPVSRRIELSAHITSQGASVSSGMGQLVYEAPLTSASVPNTAGGTVVIPPPPAAPVAGTVVIPPPPSAPVGGTVVMPPSTPVTPPAPTPPNPVPVTPSPAIRSKPLRKTTNVSSLFGPAPVPEPTPEPTPEPPPPVVETPPPAEPEPPNPTKKKSNMRRTDGLGDLFS